MINRGQSELNVTKVDMVFYSQNLVDQRMEYHDSVIQIMEVPYLFPTGFYAQEVTKIFEWRTNGVTIQTEKIKNYIKELKNLERKHQ